MGTPTDPDVVCPVASAAHHMRRGAAQPELPQAALICLELLGESLGAKAAWHPERSSTGRVFKKARGSVLASWGWGRPASQPASRESTFSLTGRGKRPSRAFPGSPAITFSSTGRGKKAIARDPNDTQRATLGPHVWGLKLAFPRQAEGKGHREHPQRALKLHCPRQAKGKGHPAGPKRRPTSSDQSLFWSP